MHEHHRIPFISLYNYNNKIACLCLCCLLKFFIEVEVWGRDLIWIPCSRLSSHHYVCVSIHSSDCSSIWPFIHLSKSSSVHSSLWPILPSLSLHLSVSERLLSLCLHTPCPMPLTCPSQNACLLTPAPCSHLYHRCSAIKMHLWHQSHWTRTPVQTRALLLTPLNYNTLLTCIIVYLSYYLLISLSLPLRSIHIPASRPYLHVSLSSHPHRSLSLFIYTHTHTLRCG